MELQNNPPSAVIDAFHLMWGNFPEPVSLVHKSREVAAVNKAHQKLGILAPGMNCAKLGEPGLHKGCLANQALKAGEAVHAFVQTPDREVMAFWVPLDGHPEFYLHFSLGMVIEYQRPGK